MPKIRLFPAVASSLLALAATQADAAIVCRVDQNIAVPQNGEGVYVNFVTGIHAATEGAVPGFDFDPYASQASDPVNQLRFYWGSASNNGAGVVTIGDTYAVLIAGDVVGPDSLFSRAAFTGNTDAWQAGVTAGYLGTRFTNEATNAINYGWVRLTTTASRGFPLTIVDWCYDDEGSAITIPAPEADRVFCDGFDDLACEPVPAL